MSFFLAWLLKNPLLAAAAIAAAVLGAALGLRTYQLHTATAHLAEVQIAWAQDRAQAQAAALAESEKYRALETQWATAQKEITDDADRKVTQARADAAVADAAAGKLQQRVAALVAAARAAAANPSASQGGPAADDPIGMLAELQRRADQAAGRMAQIADERGIAGEACERAYSELTAP